MKTDIARQSLVTAFLTLIAVSVAALCFGRKISAPVVSYGQLFPGELVTDFQLAYPIWAHAAAVLCTLFTGLSLGRLSNRYNLYAGNCYLAIPLFGIAACGIAVAPAYLMQSLSALLLTLAFKNYCLAFRNGYGFNGLFRGSLYLGLLPLLTPRAIGLLLLMPLSVSLFHRTFRELSVALFGLSLPAFLLCYLCWSLGGDFTEPLSGLFSGLAANLGLPQIPRSSTPGLLASCFLAGGLIVLTLGSIVIHLQNMYLVSQKARVIFLFCICLFVLTLATYLFGVNPVEAVSLAAVPVSVLLPVFFVRTHRSLASFIYLIILVCCFISIFAQ